MSKWSELPKELLDEIAKRLHFYADYARMRSVCVAWRSVLPKTCSPYLLLPYDEETATARDFLCPFENKVYQLELPELRGKVVRGSSHGWVIAFGRGLELCLVNPFTRAQIQLPPLDTFPEVEAYHPEWARKVYMINSGLYPEWASEVYLPPSGQSKSHYLGYPTRSRDNVTRELVHLQNLFIGKIVLSANPSLANTDYTIMTIAGQYSDLAFYRSGDKKWTCATPADQIRTGDEEERFFDIVYHEGQFYALGYGGGLWGFDMSSEHPKMTQVVQPETSMENGVLYLVKMKSGELVMVQRTVDGWRKEVFNVFKLDPGRKTWVSSKNGIGDEVLFLGYNASLSYSCHDIPGSKGNCIYFTDNYENRHSYTEGGCEIGVYNLEAGSVQPLPGWTRIDDDILAWPPPIWVTPNPCS